MRLSRGANSSGPLNVDGNPGKGGSISEDDAVGVVVLALEMEKVGCRVFGIV